jgi:ABC-type Zn uptake system ZnuABC Zn-binding protein ZnuA
MSHRWGGGIAALACALILTSCTQRIQGNGPVKVAASIPPLADMARQIGGERVTVELLVPPGSSVHTYEPTPRQVEFVSGAQLLILNGIGLEFWAPKVVDAANNAGLRVVNTAEGIPVLQDDHGEGGNPHVWLDPVYAMRQAEQVRDALIAVDPEHEVTYRDNAGRYISQLEALDRDIRTEVGTWQHRQFIAMHSAWAYFAQRYGLEQMAAIEEFPGKEPSAEYLAQLVDLIRLHQVPAVFAEPQLPPKVAEAVAGEAKAQVVVLDPLGGTSGTETYVELMRRNLKEMAGALK